MADWTGTRRPGSITLATTVMVVRAVIGLLGIVLVFAVKDHIHQAIAENNHDLSASDVDTATNVAIGIALVFAVLVFLFYIWLATKIRRGRNWARIVTIVIAAVGVLAAIATSVRPTANATRGGNLFTGALDLIVLIALATPSASAWCHQDRTVDRYR
jgi:uncharacterized BrkB/YihY/UPF0761 family membrane protein